MSLGPNFLRRGINMNWRQVGIRAGLTFMQAFLAVVIVTGVANISSWTDLKPAIVAAVAALLSFVYNIVREYSSKESV